MCLGTRQEWHGKISIVGAQVIKPKDLTKHILPGVSAFLLMLMPSDQLPGCLAQMPMGINEAPLFTQMQQIAGALRSYYGQSGTFPQQPQDEDKMLNYIYGTVFGGSAKEQDFHQNGRYRVLGSMWTDCDQTIRDIPVDMWRKRPPENWSAPANTIVILTDGESRYMIWAASLNGTPIMNSDQQTIIFSAKLSHDPSSTQ